MATSAAPTVEPGGLSAGAAEPLIEAGDRLSRAEFERRYERLPELKKAELIEGTVYIPSPVRVYSHAKPHGQLGVWLGLYAAETAGVECADNPTVRLDLDNEPQPDLVLLKLPAKGGQARISADDCIEGAPELVVEIVGSSRAYDLHQKKGAYRRNGVREYLAWITGEQRLAWWRLREGDYQELAAAAGGLLKSDVFPGLWLDAAALLRGLGSPEHRAFLSASGPVKKTCASRRHGRGKEFCREKTQKTQKKRAGVRLRLQGFQRPRDTLSNCFNCWKRSDVNSHVGRPEALSRRDNPTIARRFSAGSRLPRSPRPEGTLEAPSHKATDSAVPSGRMQHQTAFPALKRLSLPRSSPTIFQ